MPFTGVRRERQQSRTPLFRASGATAGWASFNITIAALHRPPGGKWKGHDWEVLDMTAQGELRRMIPLQAR